MRLNGNGFGKTGCGTLLTPVEHVNTWRKCIFDANSVVCFLIEVIVLRYFFLLKFAK